MLRVESFSVGVLLLPLITTQRLYMFQLPYIPGTQVPVEAEEEGAQLVHSEASFAGKGPKPDQTTGICT